jgi:hypothetical protein
MRPPPAPKRVARAILTRTTESSKHPLFSSTELTKSIPFLTQLDARFHVTRNGFLPNRPHSIHGVAIRVVDANIVIETAREFTGSTENGAIDHIIEGDLTGLTLNALGVATVGISATDGRANPDDQTGFLWSNTVRKDFSQ